MRNKNKGSNRNITKNKKMLLRIIPAILALCLLLFLAYDTKKENEYIVTYDQVVENILNGEITKIEARNNMVTVYFKNGDEKVSTIPSIAELSAIVTERIQNGDSIEFKVTSTGNFNLSSLLSIAMLIFYFRLFKKQFGEDYNVSIASSKVVFEDVAGIDEEKGQLVEVVEFLKNPARYTEAGARIPKGILLTGDPGVGKTLLAKAIAGEAGVSFFQVNGSSFEEKFVGVGASRIRKLFNKAKKAAPSIIFIDELDSLAKDRYGNKQSYSEQSLNQLLSEMDGFDSRDNVIVIAATNHPEVLDSAVTRPGRFDRKISIPLPDLNARKKILEVHSRNKYFADDVSLEDLARKTVGFSGANLENVLNEAAIYAVNHGRTFISNEDLTESIARVLVGLEKKNSAITYEDRRRTAVHEAGHAIVSKMLRPDVDILGISITPRGAAGGYNFFNGTDKFYSTKNDLYKELQVLYAGRIAEELILCDVSHGASNDLERASKIIYDMVNSYGMTSNNALLVKITGHNDFNQNLESSRMDEIMEISSRNYKNAQNLLQREIFLLRELSDLLLRKESLTKEEIDTFIEAYLNQSEE